MSPVQYNPRHLVPPTIKRLACAALGALALMWAISARAYPVLVLPNPGGILKAVVPDASGTTAAQQVQGVTIAAGSTAQVNFAVVKQDGTAADLTGAQVLLTVKHSVTDVNPLISRQATITNPATLGVGYFPLVIADTLTMRGVYQYDVFVTWPDGSRTQVVPSSAWNVTQAQGQPGQTVTVPSSQTPLAQGPQGPQGFPSLVQNVSTLLTGRLKLRSDGTVVMSDDAVNQWTNIGLPSLGPGAGTQTLSTGETLTFDAQGRVTGIAPTTRSILCGTGLSGCGTLAADRTLSVAYGRSAGTAVQGNDAGLLPLPSSSGAVYVVSDSGSAYSATQLYPTLSGESGVTNRLYPPGDVRRYGGVAGSGNDNTTAMAAALTAAAALQIPAYFPSGVWRTTSGFTNSTFAGDVKIKGDGRKQIAAGSGQGTVILLDSTSPTSFFYNAASTAHLSVENITFQCNQFVQDRAFIEITANVGSFDMTNVDFESVERPVVLKSTGYFQTSTMKDILFRNSGTIHSEQSQCGGTFCANVLTLINVDHEGGVPVNTPKVIMNLQGINTIIGNGVTLEGAQPASGWTVLNLDSGVSAAGPSNLPNAVFTGYWSEWTTFTPTQLAMNGVGARFSMARGVLDGGVTLNNGSILTITDSVFAGSTYNFGTLFTFSDAYSHVIFDRCSMREVGTMSNAQVSIRNSLSMRDGTSQALYMAHDARDGEVLYEWDGGLVRSQSYVTFPADNSFGDIRSVVTDSTYNRLIQINPNGQTAPSWSMSVATRPEWAGLPLKVQLYAKFRGGTGGSFNQIVTTGVVSTTQQSVTEDAFAYYNLSVNIPTGGGSITFSTSTNKTITNDIQIAALRVSVGDSFGRLPRYERPATIESRGTAVPTVGVFAVGDRIVNTTPASASAKGWRNTAAGGLFSTTRANLTAYSQGTWAQWTTGATVWEVTTSGTSAASPPDITGAVVGTQVTDGTVVWTCQSLTAASFIADEALGSVPSANLATTGVTPGTYGSSSLIPVLVVNAQGQITNASTASAGAGVYLPLAGGTMTGDIILKANAVLANSAQGSANTVGISIQPNIASGTTGVGLEVKTAASVGASDTVFKASNNGTIALAWSGGGVLSLNGGSGTITASALDRSGSVSIGNASATSIVIGRSGLTSNVSINAGQAAVAHTWAATSTGTHSLWTVTSPADTGQTAATEVIGYNWNSSATRQWVGGGVWTKQREHVYQAPTYSATATTTIPEADTVDITGCPVAGTNMSITTCNALRLESGLFSMGGTTFSNLGSPANGAFTYCSDCTVANPCAGSGTGALAKRLNGAWVCN